jgi:hypothetical protein
MVALGLLDATNAVVSARRRGVGYAEHRSHVEGWDASLHDSKQVQESKRLQQQLDLLCHFLNADVSKLDFEDILIDSELGAVVASILSNDSFTDVCKHVQLYLQVFKLVSAMLRWPKLRPLIEKLRDRLYAFVSWPFL